ncbi:protein kinase C and casein kinase substrate in neurons protein 1 [Nematostella vectensis]|uniref:protein kinase C and casein kinase substrate in neurons protein 1 n=1 Tax=Nematostella vectensis TaxID=45351 RepID=UPI002077775F|nr:protein kinase C and casein kinase substrate in neurons protein 1 [Nematostella vectensis]
MSIKGTPRGSEETLTASSDSFWDVGNYKRTVKRVDDGSKLCDEFMKMVTERAEIEARYAAKLKAWAKKWEEVIKAGSEYGSMEEAFKGAVDEANSRASVHTQCRDDLLNDVVELVKKWKGDNYQKSMFQWKQVKEAEEGFARAQKPWAKLLMKVMRSRKAYHNAAKATEQAKKLQIEASSDPNVPQEKFKKLTDAVEKARRDMQKCEDKYNDRLENISKDNPRYERDMTEQFERCQAFEQKRKDFFKDALMKYHSCLDVSRKSEFSGIFLHMSTTFQMADSSKDLDYWSRLHGVAMPKNWPRFEPYDEDLHGSMRRGTGSYENGERSSMGYDSTSVDYDNPREYTEPSAGYQQQPSTYDQPSSGYMQPPPAALEYSAPSYNQVQSAPQQYNDAEQSNPFSHQDSTEEDEFGAIPPPMDDLAVPVLALYDYEAAEDDELSFKAGEIVTKLSERDDQGWCRGRINHRTGLFPAEYVEAL